MLPRNIPRDINVELLLSYFPEGACKVAFKGLHKRNSYKDIVDIEEKGEALLFSIARKSLYNKLPEYMFHPLDRFDIDPKADQKQQFSEEYQKQEKEEENAYAFFAPFDLLLLKQRTLVRKRLNDYIEKNKILIDILCDNLTDEKKSNRFIKQALSFIPSCKIIRGDKTLLTFMLRKIFMEEGLKIEVQRDIVTYTDIRPRYVDDLDYTIEETYVGNVFEERTTIYDIHYWSEEDCNDEFLTFVKDIDVFREFIQDYFISIEETLRFSICKDEAPLKLSDDIVLNYLNYNTNL